MTPPIIKGRIEGNTRNEKGTTIVPKFSIPKKDWNDLLNRKNVTISITDNNKQILNEKLKRECFSIVAKSRFLRL
jgi:hypothetical protein